MKRSGVSSDILWRPSPEAFSESAMARFAAAHGFDPRDYVGMHRWSVSEPEAFWSALWDFAETVGEKGDRFFVPDEAA